MKDLSGIPDWLKWLGGVAGTVGAAALYLRQFLSKAKLERTADEADVHTILRLQAQLVVERDRADALMRDRESMVKEIGELKGEVRALRDQVAALLALVEDLRGDRR